MIQVGLIESLFLFWKKLCDTIGHNMIKYDTINTVHDVPYSCRATSLSFLDMTLYNTKKNIVEHDTRKQSVLTWYDMVQH
jgi:hypothetical protein